jgi:hypothetical protein
MNMNMFSNIERENKNVHEWKWLLLATVLFTYK